MRRHLLFVTMLAALPVAAAGADDAVLRVEASEPRAYGYQVGDHLQRRVVVHAPAGWVLDEASVPRPGARGTALELRSVQRRSVADGGGQRIELDLDYQVFLAPAAVRTVEIAPIALRFAGASRSEDLRIDAWPVTIAPLVQVEAPTRRGLGELQPDRPPLLRDTSTLRTRLVAWAAIALLLIATLAVAYLGPPWRAARNRPFGIAWRQLRRLPAQPDDEAWRDACVRLHGALNRTAGEVLFERDLDAFVQRHPGFAPLRDELQRFLHTTREQFFGGARRSADDGRWLRVLCSRCR
uniref:hypothetical protein n=1 Tax=Variovorax sp. YR752 TaxID=1884383 RepID=UPI003137CCF8